MCKCCSSGKHAGKYKQFAFLNGHDDHDHGHDDHDHDHPGQGGASETTHSHGHDSVDAKEK
jgi:hypothetical protein